MLVARRFAGAKNPSRQTVSYLGYTTPAFCQGYYKGDNSLLLDYSLKSSV